MGDAILSAREAFRGWSNTSWDDRQSYIRNVSPAIALHKRELTDILVKEAGKPRVQAALEVDHALGFLDYYATESFPAEEVIQENNHFRLSLHYMPRGVVGAICPWNFPLILSVAKIAAALAAGNSVIVKPSPFTPYSILKVAELAIPILPPGVFQALNGDESAGPYMTQHPGIDKISFTGSTSTGKRILAASSSTLKECTLELGGNDPAIICSDVDIQAVAEQVAVGSFFNSGQFCLASKRIYIHRDVFDDFRNAMVDIVKQWRVGSAHEDVTLGPVQNQMQFEILKDLLDDCKANGYSFALEGGPGEGPGYMFRPTIVDRPPDDSRIVTEEPFGPILPLLSWAEHDELISRVNNTKTGLGASVWTSDLRIAGQIAGQIESGSVWINSFAKPLPQGYLAGHKESGLGGEWGRKGLMAYCTTQTRHAYKT